MGGFSGVYSECVAGLHLNMGVLGFVFGGWGAQGGLSVSDRREPIISCVAAESSLGVCSFRAGLNE